MQNPLHPEQQQQLNTLLQGMTPQQTAWLGGYLTGLSAGEPGAAQAAEPQVTVGGSSLTVLYGSQTGNAEEIAETVAGQAKAKGFEATLTSMGDYKPNQLKNESNMMVVVSTHGEGDPPDMAEELHEYIYGKKAPKLEGVQFTVLSLGDTSYEFFCKTGKDFDQRFEELGGKRFYPRVDCDLDYDEEAENWMNGALETLLEQSNSVTVSAPTAGAVAPPAPPKFDRKNPFGAEILDSVNLNGRGSGKETLHIELSLEDSGLHYEPGDALGVYPNNDPALIEQILSALQFNGSEEVDVGGDTVPLKLALENRLEATVLTKPVVAKYAALADIKELEQLLGNDRKDEFREYIEGRDLVDLLRDYPANGFGAQDFAGILRKLPPRLYSIASSLLAYPDEVHLTVAVVRYNAHGRDRSGVCSAYFAERTSDDSRVPVYVDTNKNFKLPEDPSTPIIMVGPGTGIAPFRAFVQHREEMGASGPNWLFFGDRHFQTDFLYQAEWQDALKKGNLTRMDVAFSRDQKNKMYVQHRMLERSAEFYAWLQDGAHVYVCGDEKHMAHDVHDALLKIVREQGSLSEDNAADYVRQLQKDKRYQRDVY